MLLKCLGFNREGRPERSHGNGLYAMTYDAMYSACIGAICSFLIARYLGQDAVTKIKGTLQSLDDKIGNNGFYSVFILRLVPLFPFNGLNVGLGLTKVSFRNYTLATLLGMLPGTFVYTSLGSAGRRLSLSDPSTWLRIQVWGPFLLVIILSLLPKIFKTMTRAHLRKNENGLC